MDQTKVYKSYYKDLFNSIPDYWDEIYSANTFYGYHYQQRKERIVELLAKAQPRKGDKMLDVGCGAGGYFPMYLDLGMNVTGVDASEKMVEKINQVYKKQVADGLISASKGDIEHLGFEDESFDFVVSAGVFMYLPDMRAAAKEVHRVLKVGGHALLNVDNHRSLAAFLDLPKIFMNILSKILPRKKNTNGDMVDCGKAGVVPQTKSYTSTSLKNIATDLGFEIVNENGHGFGPIKLFGEKVLPPATNLFLYRLTTPLLKNKLLGRLGTSYTVLVRKI